MASKVFLTAPGNGLARAEGRADGDWDVEHRLEGTKVNCLAALPSNPQVVYAGTHGNGVLRSNDRGLTWEPSGMDGEIVKSLAVSPRDPNTIYAGTKPAYMFVSRDGGSTWEELDGFRRIPNRWW